MVDASGVTVGVLELRNRRGVDGGVMPFTHRDEQALASLAAVAAVSVRNARLAEQLSQSHLDTILRLASAAEFRDGDTGDHIRRMSLYSETIARVLGRGPDWCRCILFASPMHDVGKLGVADSILKKPGPLSAAERAAMQQHTVLGARLLAGSDNEIIAMAERIALGHHERWDGKGYPHGRVGPEVPEEARIVAVADVFDALTNARVYKRAFSLEEAYRLMSAEKERHFDPVILEAFLSARDEIEAIYEAYRPA
jgi:putative two-component system response regulator